MADLIGIDQVGRQGGPKLVGLATVSSETGISERTLRRWCAAGELPAVDISCGEKQALYKTTFEDVRAFLAGRRVASTRPDVGADVSARNRREQMRAGAAGA